MYTIAYSPSELINQYNHLSSGHFFDAGTMRFFKSRVTSNYRRLSDTEALFVTTEKGPSGERLATIRRAVLVPSDNYRGFKITIDTVGEFNSLSLATAIRRLAKV